MYKILLTSLILLSSHSFGAIKKIESRLDHKKRFLKNSKIKVATIKKELNSIENDINNINAKFSKVVDLKRILNREIHEGKLNSKKMRGSLEEDLKGIKK